jgi:hypothetical protein
MDESTDTLGMEIRNPGPGSLTGMETTVSEAVGVEDRDARRPVDLSFLAPSGRAGSLGRVGEYEIYGVLGRGAMGIVLKGYDRALNRVVAVKVQDPGVALSRRARARFLREARAAAAINHPSVVTIYKVDVVRERPYLAMECVAGSLRERIKGGEPFELVEVLKIGLQVAEGLAAAHKNGVIHRDIKPANILLEDGATRVKISDFGLALDGLTDGPITTEKVVGTPAYMSPEQVRGEPLDARSDLFSLGCVLYAMLSGRSPFGSENAAETIRSVCDDHPDRPVGRGHRCDRGLIDLVMRLLAKCPDDRPGSTEEVIADLESLLGEASLAPSSESLEPAAVGPIETASAPVVAPASRRGAWPALTIASLALATAACVLVWMRGPGEISSTGGAPPIGVEPPVWTVGKGDSASYRDLASALLHVRPGGTLRLADPARYEGPIVLNDPKRFRDLTIEGVAGATLTAPDGVKSVVTIDNVPGVTIRDLKIETRVNQHAVDITRETEGTTLRGLCMASPEDSKWTQVYIHGGASGSVERPIVVSGSSFDVAHGGVTILGDGKDSIGFVSVRGNRFRGDDEHVHVLQNVHDIAITGNTFVSGQPLTLNADRHRIVRVIVANNTFFRTRVWLHPADSHPDQVSIDVCNNAILESGDVSALIGSMALGKWVFRNNLWEPGPDVAAPNPGVVAEACSKLEVLSRDVDHADFLRPSPRSVLARSGAGGDRPLYVGALAPTLEISRIADLGPPTLASRRGP